ncbi:MAG: NADPH:quinone oxidoreductase family protein [Saprospiraceae bacterium]|nr:NADPH:quinone oxidoreductase family protein [Bacteroidia bacterium]NNE14621.1 NADPH:quinone oxidoreductase family protein [Saprospiraceae bacterium]NNL92524.1 NADPH:quinone oxidoreductase family protein [Saprospiraceae bacterium]
MKAILCEKHGPPSDLVLKDMPSPKPKDDQVIVTVKACSVNFPDTLIIQGKYQFKPDLPFSPGSDISGIVKEVGEKVKNVKVGDEVFGFVRYGGFAEEVAVHKSQVFPKLPNMSFPMSASFMLAYGTSYHALKDRAQLKEGETLVVLGASGGVGLAAVELAKNMGARVIAAASTDDKLNLCKEYGADAIINYSKEDLKNRIKELTDGKGADVIYDPIGDKYTEPALRATAWKGRYLIVGFAAGEIPKIPMNLPLLKGCQIVGVFWGSFSLKNPSASLQNSMELMQMFSQKKINPYIQKLYPLEDAPKALEDMMNRKVKGKVIVTMA